MKIRIDLKWPLVFDNASQVRTAYKLLEINGLDLVVQHSQDAAQVKQIIIDGSPIPLRLIPREWYKTLVDPFQQFLESHVINNLADGEAREIWDGAQEALKEELRDISYAKKFHKEIHPALSETTAFLNWDMILRLIGVVDDE